MISAKELSQRRGQYLVALYNTSVQLPPALVEADTTDLEGRFDVGGKEGYSPMGDGSSGITRTNPLSSFQQDLAATLHGLLTSYQPNWLEVLRLRLCWHDSLKWLTINPSQVILIEEKKQLSWFDSNDFIIFYRYFGQLVKLIQQHISHSVKEEKIESLGAQIKSASSGDKDVLEQERDSLLRGLDRGKRLALDWLHHQLKESDHPYQLNSHPKDLDLTHLERTFYAEFSSPPSQIVVGSKSDLVVSPTLVLLKPAYLSAQQVLQGQINLAPCQTDSCQRLRLKIQGAKYCYPCGQERKKRSDAALNVQQEAVLVGILNNYAQSEESVMAENISYQAQRQHPQWFKSGLNARSTAQWINKNQHRLKQTYGLIYHYYTHRPSNIKFYTFSRT